MSIHVTETNEMQRDRDTFVDTTDTTVKLDVAGRYIDVPLLPVVSPEVWIEYGVVGVREGRMALAQPEGAGEYLVLWDPAFNRVVWSQPVERVAGLERCGRMWWRHWRLTLADGASVIVHGELSDFAVIIEFELWRRGRLEGRGRDGVPGDRPVREPWNALRWLRAARG